MDFFYALIKMEKQLNFALMLPLQQIALRRVAIGLWTQPDILTLIEKFREQMLIDFSLEKWHTTVEIEVSGKVSKLQLPESLKKEMMSILKPIGLQILRWKGFHEYHLSPTEYTFPCEFFDAPIFEKLHWTTTAMIDYEKTAEELIRCKAFDIVRRYKLACLYCLEHYIPELWKELPSEKKMWFYDEEDISHIKEPYLQFAWPYILKGEEEKLDGIPAKWGGNQTPFHQFMFAYSSCAGNKSAAKYFLQKLSLKEKEASLIKTVKDSLCTRMAECDTFPISFPKANIVNVVFYLLAIMTPEQQMESFRKTPANVLVCLLDWPLQDAFLNFADAMWTWMRCADLECREDNYDLLILKLGVSVRDSDYCLPSLYQNFFLRSPSDFRKHFVDRECQGRFFNSFIAELFDAGDTETINVIFSNLDAADRLRLLLSKKTLRVFFHSISRGGGVAVEKCLRKTGLSKEHRMLLREAFMALLRRRGDVAVESKTPEWTGFFEFLDGTDAGAFKNKRFSDDDTLTESKKLCCVKEHKE